LCNEEQQSDWYSCFGRYSGGYGTKDDPFRIATINDLKNLSEKIDHWDKYFVQVAHIDASSTSTWNDGAGFNPIGTAIKPFRGQYNGQHFTISNLFIKKPDWGYVGLWSSLSGATITDVHLTNSTINGFGRVGLIAGYSANNSVIKNCSTQNCHLEGYSDIGGIVGIIEKTQIKNCFSNNYIKGSDYVGGICGNCSFESTVSNSVSSGITSGIKRTGGIVGSLHGSNIQNCISQGAVIGDTYIGFVGFNQSNSIITKSYNSGSVTGKSPTGAIAGINYAFSSKCAFDKQTTLLDKAFGVDINAQKDSVKLLGFDEFVAFDFAKWFDIMDQPDDLYPWKQHIPGRPYLYWMKVALSNGPVKNDSIKGYLKLNGKTIEEMGLRYSSVSSVEWQYLSYPIQKDSFQYKVPELPQYAYIQPYVKTTEGETYFGDMLKNSKPCVPVNTEETVRICKGESYHGYTNTSIITRWRTSVGGCDSIIRTNLYVEEVETPTIVVKGDTLQSSALMGNQWYLGQTAIKGASDPSYTIEKTGTYSVQVTSDKGCVSEMSVGKYVVFSSSDAFKNSSVVVYPNPTYALVHVAGLPQGQPITISVFNLLGKKVMEQSGTGTTAVIDLSGLVNGVYYVRFGENIENGIKIIKE
jgi:hypothetical protein